MKRLRTSIANRRTRKRTSARVRGARAVVVLLLATLAAVAFHAPPARGQAVPVADSDLREIGEMDLAVHMTDAPGVPPPMIVDTVHSVGFAIGSIPGGGGNWLAMYDLSTLKFLDKALLGAAARSEEILRWSIDEQGERLFRPAGLGLPSTSDVCDPAVGAGRFTYRYSAVDGNRRLQFGILPEPCDGRHKFVALASSTYVDAGSHPPKRKLLQAGTYREEGWRYQGSVSLLDADDNEGAPLLIRQLDVDKLYSGNFQQALEWEIDLRFAQCGRREPPFVHRSGNEVVTYCHDTKPAGLGRVGEQGYVVTIPLGDDGRPSGFAGTPPVPDPSKPPDPTKPLNQAMLNADMRRVPALPGEVVPFVDPSSGRLLLLTNDSRNGNAVWVFDPKAERFIGTITGGFLDQTADKTAAGFDPVRGRAYLFTSGGILVAPIRHSPLPPGKLVPVMTEGDDRLSTTVIAVAPELRRLFIPHKGRGKYVVLEDLTPEPVTSEPADPDRLTTQIPEEDDKTSADAAGAAHASGAHIVVTGGIARAVDQSDPFCRDTNPLFGISIFNETAVFGGECAADLMVSRGHREAFLAATTIEVGTATGAVARAVGLSFADNDHATDRDVKRIGECHRRSNETISGAVVPTTTTTTIPGTTTTSTTTPYQGACSQLQKGIRQHGQPGEQDRGPDFSTGTSGRDGKGFPIPGSHCAAFGSKPDNAQQPSGSDGLPESALSFSAVTCDPAAARATGHAANAGLTAPAPDDVVLSVARTSSEARSERTAEGQRTTAIAVAEGVRVGPLQIARIETEATVVAKGRTGTAQVETFERQWCGIRVATELGGDLPPEAQEAFDEIRGLTSEACFDPLAGEISFPGKTVKVADLIVAVNQVLGRVRLTIPKVETDTTPGGYQAVVTKDPEERAADQAVNDDDSHTVSGLQVVLYNDGAEGRNRLVFQFAGVHVESRYGIVQLPQFEVPEFSFTFTAPSPAVVVRKPGVPAVPGRPAQAGTAGEEILGIAAVRPAAAPVDDDTRQFVQARGNPLQKFFGWVWNHPLEALLLFVLWGILSVPVFLFVRRRSFARALMHATPGARMP